MKFSVGKVFFCKRFNRYVGTFRSSRLEILLIIHRVAFRLKSAFSGEFCLALPVFVTEFYKPAFLDFVTIDSHNNYLT